MMTIGELSRRTGANVETIRYYERIGVLPLARRQDNGRRFYGEGDIRRLLFIRHARELGFDLPSVRSLLSLQVDPDGACGLAADLATTQLAEITRRIEQLTALRDKLAGMVGKGCKGRVADCRIIETLAG